jgi:hypothetical protein
MHPFAKDFWANVSSDGAFSSVGPFNITRADLDEVFNAWSHERSGRIETTLVLEQAGHLLATLLMEEKLGTIRKRQARRVLKAIRRLQKEDPGKFDL